MKILGIDPGYERMGIAIIEKEKNSDLVLFSGCVKTSPKLPMEQRLLFIGNAIREVVKKYKPDTAAIEELYFAKNTKTALLVAEARGVIRYALESEGIPCSEYHPNAIKIAITGHGASDKTAIAFMIPKLVKFDATKKIDDELDAIAVALTHGAINKK